MNKLVIFLLTIWSISSSALAQNGSIQGVVSDEFGPLPGAKVELVGTDLVANCDIDGLYSFTIDPGTYTIKVSYLMYQSEQREVHIDFGNLNAEENFALLPGSSIDENVSLGSRFAPMNQLESPVSIDIITNEQIINSAYINLSQVLMYLVPSFNSNRQTISDGTDHISPATMSGLGPDQYLVLINGKRRHSSSLVNVNGTIGRGSVSTDFDAIPAIAIDRVEIMRDGAGAQYGSDAIAGVINVVLKSQANSLSVITSYLPTLALDGQEEYLGLNFGVAAGAKGFLNFTAELNRRNSINRSGNYTGNVYSTVDSIDQLLIDQNNFFNQTGFDDQQTMEIGSSSALNANAFTNGSFSINDKTELYINGGLNFRQSIAHAFYRFPKDEEKVVLELHPNGFSPEINTQIIDQSGTIGLRGTYSKWFVDFSNTTGKNSLDYSLKNSNNASMGTLSPTDFDAGGFSYSQSTTNLDLSRTLEKVGFMNKINIALGAEFRIETYAIFAGDEASWINGGDTLSDGTPRVSGSQGFVGFQPSNALLKRRTNAAIYGDSDWHLTKKWLIKTAARYENYSDFGENVSWKIATRFKIDEKRSLRAGVGTNFRAPSLHQLYFNNISTQFADGTSYQVGTFKNESSVTKAFGIDNLKAETSTNYSFGLTGKPFKNFTLNADAYYIQIRNRVVLSGRFSDGYEGILNPLGAGAAQFFTNGINTSTFGVDARLSYHTNVGQGILRMSAHYNHSQTRVDKVLVPDVLSGSSDTFFNREEISRMEVAQPRNKAILNVLYVMKKWTFGIKNTYFGKIEYIHPSDGEEVNWVLNEYSEQIESRDQVFNEKIITDLNIAYTFNQNFTLSIGGSNIFNVLPDQHTHSANTSNGSFIYSRRVQQFGVRGAGYYARLKFSL